MVGFAVGEPAGEESHFLPITVEKIVYGIKLLYRDFKLLLGIGAFPLFAFSRLGNIEGCDISAFAFRKFVEHDKVVSGYRIDDKVALSAASCRRILVIEFDIMFEINNLDIQPGGVVDDRHSPTLVLDDGRLLVSNLEFACRMFLFAYRHRSVIPFGSMTGRVVLFQEINQCTVHISSVSAMLSYSS